MRPRLGFLQFALLGAAAVGLAACEPGLREQSPMFDREPLAPTTVQPAQPTTPIQLAQQESPRMAPLVERGTGQLVRAPPDRSRASILRNATGEVTLNVVDGDLREVVRLVLEDTLGVNYIIDPAVGGAITVQTSQPVRAEDVPAMLDAILRVNGAALIRVDDLFKVVPLDQALTSGPSPDIHPLPDAGRDGFGIRVVPVRFVSAAELATLLEPFVPPGGSLQVDPERNMLLLAGTARDLATLTDLVTMFDVDWLEGMSFGLFPLEIANSAALVGELDQVFALEAGPVSGVVRFVPIERLNAVLVLSSQPAYLDRAETWIRRLDEAGETGEPQAFVYAVQNGRASDLAQVLGEIFNVPSAAVGAQDLLAPGLEPAAIGSSLIGRSQFETEGDVESTEPRAATGSQTGMDTTTSARQAARQPSLSSGQSSRLQTGTSGAAAPEIRIIGDATTNSLVIWASPREYRKVKRALDQLDIVPLQVLIEATVVEVQLNDLLRYGVEWFFQTGDFSATLSQRLRGAVAGLFPGFSALFTGGDVTAVLNALERVTNINVISSPHLLVLDNQTARLQVGDQVPITVQQAQAVTGSDAPIVNSIEFRDTGVILSVTPRVNVSGLVTMELQQEVSNVARAEAQTTTSEQTSPTISTRQINSTVAVQSGETIVLGGLIQDNQERSLSGVPFLARLPIVGALFGTQSRTGNRTELLVLLTPRVVRGTADARALTSEMRRRLRSVAPLEETLR